MKFLLTCEHAGNKVPPRFEHLFLNAGGELESHRGFDPGALDLFQALESFADFSHYHKTSRLLVEVNRSLHHPQLFSEFSKELSKQQRQFILEEYYFPYRDAIEKDVSEALKAGEEVLHLSVHSFTPELLGEVRNADIGLLFDPARPGEKNFCKDMKTLLQREMPGLKLRFNYPYLGKADGFTTYLRKKFPQQYSGIEIEINQRFVQGNKLDSLVRAAVVISLRSLLKKYR